VVYLHTSSLSLSDGCSVLVSKYKAVDNKAAMGRTIAVASALGVITGTVFAGLFTLVPRGALRLMGAPDALMPSVSAAF
jgi:Na+-driven multidrug efflux pump